MKQVPIKIVKSTIPWVDNPYYVTYEDTVIAHCSTSFFADMVKRSLESWQRTKDYQEWIKEVNSNKQRVKFNMRIS